VESTPSRAGWGCHAVLESDVRDSVLLGPLLVKVALSAVSEDNAVLNLDSEQPGFDFEALRAR
jgi:putative alpha-1,2-mannosidase